MASDARSKLKHKFKVGDKAFMRAPHGMGARIEVMIEAVQEVILYTCRNVNDVHKERTPYCTREADLMSREEMVAKKLMEPPR